MRANNDDRMAVEQNRQKMSDAIADERALLSGKLLSNDEVIDFALQKGMKTDCLLIGKDSTLETLDIQKAISDMKKDKILMEYQSFVQNPEAEDGFVRQMQKK